MPVENFKSQTQAQSFVRKLIRAGTDPGDIITNTLPGPIYQVIYTK